MSKKKAIHLTGSGNADVALVAKHKKDGSVVLRIFPIQQDVRSRQALDPSRYDKNDALATFKFDNVRALDNFGVFLGKMRDQMIFDKGAGAVSEALVDNYNENIAVMQRIIHDLYRKADSQRPQRSKSPMKEFEVMMGDMKDIPNEVLDSVLKTFQEIKDKRTEKSKGPESKEAGTQQQAAPGGEVKKDTEVREREIVS